MRKNSLGYCKWTIASAAYTCWPRRLMSYICHEGSSILLLKAKGLDTFDDNMLMVIHVTRFSIVLAN